MQAEQAARRQADDLVRSLREERDQALARLAELQLGSRQLQQEAVNGTGAAVRARPLGEQQTTVRVHVQVSSSLLVGLICGVNSCPWSTP